ncbi:Protein TIFY 6B [Euphorbia peplus]|nr:Protein TIFY 6B [Euphorbia peplus]
MERDFLGLSSKQPLTVVKEEVNSDGFQEIGFSKGGSGMHWPFLNKVSALPHLMSFKVAQEDNKTKRVSNDSLVSPGLLTLSTGDPFEHTQKPAIEKSLKLDRQGGANFALTAYPVRHPHEVKMFPVSNYSNPISMSNPFFKNHYATAFQNVAKPVATPQPIRPTAGYVAGITESCSKVSASPAQMTIFYAGTVSVYDSISPEKAQAIMLLAGNGSLISPNMTQRKIQVQEPISKPVASDCSPLIHPISPPSSSRLSSPLSVSSHAGAQSGSGSTSTEENLAAKTTNPISKVDTPKVATGMGSTLTSVPQARKASLARFLEKRKERVMSAAPYNLMMKTSDGIDIHL